MSDVQWFGQGGVGVTDVASRRRFLRLAGGGVLGAGLAVPLAGCSTAYPDDAVSAWQNAANEQDPRRWALAHGLLAPNPHNRQPWMADLREPGVVTLSCDGDRLLPHTDPWGRQITIGCGAFIELTVMAAKARGQRVDVQLYPNGEPAPDVLPRGHVIARMRFSSDSAVRIDPLFAFIRQRHTHKGVYDKQRVVPQEAWRALNEPNMKGSASGLLMGAVTDAQGMAQIRQITRESYVAEMSTDNTYLESARLMRIGPSEIAAHRDGISIMGTMPRLMAAVGVFDRFETPRPGTSNYQHAMAHWEAFETGSGYAWIATQGNSRRDQIAVGRAYVRSHLQATRLGIDMHPLSQALQEFAQVRPHRQAIHKLLGFDPRQTTLQMLARVGYGQQASQPSPRRGLDALLVG